METIQLKYTGLYHEISFKKVDFERHEVDDQGAVSFNGGNNWVAEVSNDGAELLQFLFPKEFREAKETDLTEPDLSRVGSTPQTVFGKAARAKVSQVTSDDASGEAVRTSQGSAGATGTATRGRSRAATT